MQVKPGISIAELTSLARRVCDPACKCKTVRRKSEPLFALWTPYAVFYGKTVEEVGDRFLQLNADKVFVRMSPPVLKAFTADYRKGRVNDDYIVARYNVLFKGFEVIESRSLSRGFTVMRLAEWVAAAGLGELIVVTHDDFHLVRPSLSRRIKSFFRARKKNNKKEKKNAN